MTAFPGRRFKRPSGATEAVAARYREILPDWFQIETNGPVLSIKAPGHSGTFFGNFILHMPLQSARYRLEQYTQKAFGDLPKIVAYVKGLGLVDFDWPALGASCHVRVTQDEVRVWYGRSDSEEEAVLTVRAIPRSELGV